MTRRWFQTDNSSPLLRELNRAVIGSATLMFAVITLLGGPVFWLSSRAAGNPVTVWQMAPIVAVGVALLALSMIRKGQQPGQLDLVVLIGLQFCWILGIMFLFRLGIHAPVAPVLFFAIAIAGLVSGAREAWCLAGLASAMYFSAWLAATAGWLTLNNQVAGDATSGARLAVLCSVAFMLAWIVARYGNALRNTLANLEAASVTVRRQAATMRQVTDTTPASISLWGTTERCEFANRTFCAIVGKSEAELLGRPYADVMPAPAISRNLPSARRALPLYRDG